MNNPFSPTCSLAFCGSNVSQRNILISEYALSFNTLHLFLADYYIYIFFHFNCIYGMYLVAKKWERCEINVSKDENAA